MKRQSEVFFRDVDVILICFAELQLFFQKNSNFVKLNSNYFVLRDYLKYFISLIYLNINERKSFYCILLNLAAILR